MEKEPSQRQHPHLDPRPALGMLLPPAWGAEPVSSFLFCGTLSFTVSCCPGARHSRSSGSQAIPVHTSRLLDTASASVPQLSISAWVSLGMRDRTLGRGPERPSCFALGINERQLGALIPYMARMLHTWGVQVKSLGLPVGRAAGAASAATPAPSAPQEAPANLPPAVGSLPPSCCRRPLSTWHRVCRDIRGALGPKA